MLLVALGVTFVTGQMLHGLNARDLNSSERAAVRYEGIIQFAGGSKAGTTPIVLSMDVQALQDAAYRGGDVYADHVWLRFNPDGSYDFGDDERCDEGRKYLSNYNGMIMTAPGKDIHIQGAPQSQLTIYSGRYVYIEDDFVSRQDPRAPDNKQDKLGAIKMSNKVATGSVNQTTAQSLTEFKLTAGDAAAGDEFGFSVAIDGNFAIVGAHFDDEACPSDPSCQSGAAYIFKLGGAGWIQEAKLTAGDAAAGDQFGVAVAIAEDRVVVGTQFDDDHGTSSGSVYIFKRDGTSWIQEAKLTAGDAAAGDQFGNSVAISGDRVIVGAIGDDDVAGGSGAAYIFTFDGVSWNEAAKLKAGDAALGDNFGVSVSIDGDAVVVGAERDDDAGSSSGSAYVFRFDGTSWNPEAKLTAGDAAAGDQFGFSVSIAAGRVVAGAHQDDDAGSNSGAAYIFKHNGTSWSQEAKLIASDADEGDDFGISVAIDNDSVVVGARSDEVAGTNSGSAYLFTFDGTSWSQLAKLTASDAAEGDQFGRFVFIAGGRILVGSFLDDDAGTSSGSAYAFISNLPPVADAGPDQTVECTSPDSAGVTLDGSGSNDPDGDQLTYTWHEDGNVIAGPTDSPTSQVTLALGGHTIELTVDDGNGGSDTDEVMINVQDTTPPDVTAALDPVAGEGGDDEDGDGDGGGSTFVVRCSATDACDPNPSITSIIAVPTLADPQVTFKIQNLKYLKINLDRNKVSVRGPDPEGFWAEVQSAGGIAVEDGQTLVIGGGDDDDDETEYEYKFDAEGNLTEINAPEVVLGCKATDASGNVGSAEDRLSFPQDGDDDDDDEFDKAVAAIDKRNMPAGFELFQNHPNPFNPETEIRFQLPEATHVVVTIFSLSGQEIRTLVNAPYEAGYHTVRWDGRDNHGSPLASGVYLYRLDAGGFSQVKKMSLLR
jgi:hypothetical protein